MDVNEQTSANRRRSARYLVNEAIYLTFRPQFQKMGKLKDISKRGVSFEYMSVDSSGSLSNGDAHSIEVDIFSSSKDFHLSRIQCKVIYDVIVRGSSKFQLFENRRCGLQFDQLSDYQDMELSCLVNNFLAFPAPVH